MKTELLHKTFITGMFLAMASISASADTEVWRLDLATESGEVSPEAFSAWMEMKGFQPFSYLFFKRGQVYVFI